MGLIRTKTPIECAFYYWINNHPESYHSLDMQRFYVLVKTVKRYSRKAKSGQWLRNKIKQSKKPMQEEGISYFCNLFKTLLEYDKAYPISLCSSTKDDRERTRGCAKGKILDKNNIKWPWLD